MHEEGWHFFTARLAAVARGEDQRPMPSEPPPGA